MVLVRLDPFPVSVAVWVQPARRLCSVVTPINHEFSCGATCFADIPVALAIRPSCDRASAGSRPSKQPRAPSGRGTGSTLRPRRPDPRRARASARRRASRVDWWPRTTARRWRCAPPQARRGCAVLVERRSRTPQHHTFCSANMCARHRRGPGKRHARQGPDSRRVGGRSGTAQARGSSTCHPWSALASMNPSLRVLFSVNRERARNAEPRAAVPRRCKYGHHRGPVGRRRGGSGPALAPQCPKPKLLHPARAPHCSLAEPRLLADAGRSSLAMSATDGPIQTLTLQSSARQR